MSRSPVAADDEGLEYLAAWRATNSLLRQQYSWSGNERNCALLSAGGRHADASAALGLNLDDDGRAAARIDWDWDGDLDLLVTNRTGPRLRLLRNESENQNGLLALRLRDQGMNHDAIGARVELRLSGPEGPLLVRGARAGEGFLAQQSAWIHFGLGGSRPHALTVRWPDGTREAFEGVGEGGRFVLERGSGRAAPWALETAAAGLVAGGAAPRRPSSQARIVLAAPVPIPRLPVTTVDGREAGVLGVPSAGERVGGVPTLVCVWAQWCAPCRLELKDVTENVEAFREAGLLALALNADQDTDRERAQAFLEEIEWPGLAAFATPEAVDVLDVFRGALLDLETRLPLPATFLLDGETRVVAMYFGGVSAEQVLKDTALFDLAPAERRVAAGGFPGRWIAAEPPAADLNYFERRFRARGLEAAAREYMLGRIHIVQGPQLSAEVIRGRKLALEGEFEQAADAFRAGIAADANDFEAHSGLGIALHNLRRFAAAAEAYAAALELRQNHADTWFNYGLVSLATGNRSEADRAARELVRLNSPKLRDLERAIMSYDDR